MITKARQPFSQDPSKYAADSLPSLGDWKTLWNHWDTVSRHMLSCTALMSKPIKLRNACIFYVGHIPTFLDILLNKAISNNDAKFGPLAAPTEPASYSRIFERGIDPDVDNPEQCHAHSDIPDSWPPLDEILQYQGKVRARLEQIYNLTETSGRPFEETIGRSVARAVWMAFEHEAMHLETLLYMMLHSDETRPPPDIETPDWETMAKNARQQRVENEWHRVPRQTVDVGMDSQDQVGEHFGW